ncbi:MAG TPA: adenosine deaminase [Acidothermaceae bacterium]|jgi:aminodeoxyfutalosine deaminase|nr:adenosine deaminase [Acidothermaceae bacterium]
MRERLTVDNQGPAKMDAVASYPKIELHVHLEGTVRPHTLLDMARRNDLPLPATTVDELKKLYEFTDFAHFIEVWILTTNVMRTADDFRQIVVDYAAEAASHGAVYLEAIFSPIERVARGVSWDDLFEGYCDGAQQAEEEHGVVVRLTPDSYRGADVEATEELATRAIKYRDRGIVGLGLGGPEANYPPEPYTKAFEIAKAGGLASVPHAGESAGADSIRATMGALQADRIRHGIRAVDDPDLMAELKDKRIVLDVCPTSNLRTRSVADLASHPLPRLINAGIACSLNTDDPAMFGTDLGTEYAIAQHLGVRPKELFDAGLQGTMCDDATRARVAKTALDVDWSALEGQPA